MTVREVSIVEYASLFESRVAPRLQDMWRGGMIIRGPLMEVVGDVICSWVGRGVLEVNDNDL